MGFLFGGHTTTTRANKISDFIVATAEYGASVPEILGTTRVSGNIIYYDDFTAIEHKDVQKAGKGGGSKHVNITYTYTVAAIIGLCEGEISGIGKIWDGKDVYEYPSDKINMTLFKGSETQQPWAYTQGKHPEKALPYKGLAYVAGVVDLGSSASFPSYNFEVKGKLLNTGDGIDVNPADYIRYVLDKAGLKDVEIKGLENYRQYCREHDLLISTPSDSAKQPARAVINDIIRMTNAAMFWSNDCYKIVVLDDRPQGNWTPDKTPKYDITEDDLIPLAGKALVQFERKDSADVYNNFPVEFMNRANGYERESVAYELKEDVADYGLRQAPSFSAKYIYTKARAVKIAEMLARKSKYERNRYTFQLPWTFCRLEVGDLVTITEPNSFLDKTVVRITGVTEKENGLLMFKAVGTPPGDYEAAQYDVHENDRPYIEMNGTASDTVPVLFQPPADMTKDGLELWIAAKGKEQNWGGCSVYLSDDDEHYIHAGDINNSSRLGEVKTYSEDKIKVSCNSQLLSGKPEDAERGNTLCWVGGECLSYTAAILQGDGNYLLSGLVRGQYNTAKRSHASGESFVRLDNYLLKIPFSKNDIGKKVYLKFISKNIFGAGEQDLADVKAYEYRLQNYFIPPVTGLTARSRYRQQVDKKSIYDVIVEWEKPDLQTYLQGDVWYKTKSATSDTFTRDWQYAGSGETQATIPQCVAGSKLLIAVCTKDTFGEVTAPDTSPQTQILVALKNEIPTTPEGFSLTFGSACTARWKEVTNADVAYYEIRIDKNPGEDTPGLLTKTNSTNCVLTLAERTGRLYLYAKSAVGKYSDPAELTYNKPKPPKPKPPKLTATLGGFSVQAEPIPTGCGGMTVYINNDTVLKTENNALPYLCEAGIYDITVAFCDIFGEGEKSESSRVVVEPKIPSEWIDREKLGLTKVENAIKDIEKTFPRLDNIDKELEKRIASGAEKYYQSNIGDTLGQVESRITQLSGTVNITIDNKIKGLSSQMTQLEGTIYQRVTKNVDGKIDALSSRITQTESAIYQNVNNKIDGVNSRIIQLDDTINLRVTKQLDGKADKANLISQINICPEAITIDGKFVHVTGDTLFDNNVIVNRMLSAKAITADKMDVSSLSAISANMGTLTAGKIKGVRYESRTGNAWIEDDEIHGMKISADAFYEAGYRVKNIDVKEVRGVPTGTYVKLPDEAKKENCVFIYGGIDYSIEPLEFSAKNYGSSRVDYDYYKTKFSSIGISDYSEFCEWFNRVSKNIPTPDASYGGSTNVIYQVTPDGLAVSGGCAASLHDPEHGGTRTRIKYKLYFSKIIVLIMRR